MCCILVLRVSAFAWAADAIPALCAGAVLVVWAAPDFATAQCVGNCVMLLDSDLLCWFWLGLS